MGHRDLPAKLVLAGGKLSQNQGTCLTNGYGCVCVSVCVSVCVFLLFFSKCDCYNVTLLVVENILWWVRLCELLVW